MTSLYVSFFKQGVSVYCVQCDSIVAMTLLYRVSKQAFLVASDSIIQGDFVDTVRI